MGAVYCRTIRRYGIKTDIEMKVQTFYLYVCFFVIWCVLVEGSVKWFSLNLQGILLIIINDDV